MRKISRVISATLSLFLFTSFSAGADVNTLKTNGDVNIASVEYEDTIITTEYNKVENSAVITTSNISDGTIIEEMYIDLNQEPEDDHFKYEVMSDAGRYRVDYEHTYINYEYEKWVYPNYNGGKGFFWFLKHPLKGERPVYEESTSSEYSRDIIEYRDAVETINKLEVVIGVSAAIGVGAIIASGVTGAALIAKIQSYLAALGVVTAVTMATDFVEAVETCNGSWNSIF